jgi:misacylated tRNA(Ala) deacylase
MTELGFLGSPEAAYERTFTARVVALPPGGVVLDRTLFYPVGGGQPADRGTLRDRLGVVWKVVDVFRSGGTAIHRLDRETKRGPSPRIGEELTGEIDWSRRHLHMRYHTGQHLVSARVFALTGLRTRHAVFGATGGRIELDGPWPQAVALATLSRDIALWIQRDLPVHIRFVPRAEYDRTPADRSGLVPLPIQVDPVRVVEIVEADRCPCGGTHVRKTSEIGPIRLDPPGALADGSAELNFTLGADPQPNPEA